MGRPASVKSIDALQNMTASMNCFHDNASSALDDLEMEVRRALEWIGHDCREYWKQEVRKARDAVTEARIQLENARAFRRVADEKKSFIDEKKALERAKRRLQIAESKVEAVAHWALAIERAVYEYRGCRSQFANWLDADFPKGVAALGRMITALESYVRLGLPADEHAPITWAAITSKEGEEAARSPQRDQGKRPRNRGPRRRTSGDLKSGIYDYENVGFYFRRGKAGIVYENVASGRR